MTIATTAPAFKEWQSVVRALETGRQILILRKGGIAEGPAGFQLDAGKFWLFPTHFHAQAEKLKGNMEVDPAADPTRVHLSSYAEVVRSKFIEDWSEVSRLDPFHLWTEETVRERFEWSAPPGIFAIAVRVYRLTDPIEVSITPEMQGCKSWVSVPHAFPVATPAVEDTDFQTRLAALRLG